MNRFLRRSAVVLGVVVVVVLIGSTGWFVYGSQCSRLRAQLDARGLQGSTCCSVILPRRVDELLPDALKLRTRTLYGPLFESLPETTTELGFLQSFPEIQEVTFIRGTIQPSVVRSLRDLPNLRHVSFKGEPTLDPPAILAECERIPQLRQITLLGVPYFSDEVLDEFKRRRPDVKVYLGRAKASGTH